MDRHPGGAGKTDGTSMLSEVVKAGGETDRMDVLSGVGGLIDWMSCWRSGSLVAGLVG